MFVKWAIIKLLITMHVAMPADIFTKAVDLMTNIPWVYRILSESRPPSGKRGRGAQTSSSNTEPVLETTHDEHLVGVHRETDSPRQGVKRTPLAHDVRYWTRRETLEKQSVCYVKATCGYDDRNERHLIKKEGSTAPAHLPPNGDWVSGL